MADERITVAAPDLPQSPAALLRTLMQAANRPQEWTLNPILTGLSVLRGRRDLSEWGRNHRAVRALLAGALGTLFENGGRGVGEAASAEVLYERGLYADALEEAKHAQDAPGAEIACTGSMLAAYAAVLAEANPKAAEVYVSRAESIADGNEPLQTGLGAAKARLAAYRGDRNAMESWLAGAPSGDAADPGAWALLLVRGRVLLALDRAADAQPLYSALRDALCGQNRPLDYAEALCGLALAGGETEPLQKAMDICAPYRYRTVFAQFGEPMAVLLDTVPGAQTLASAARSFAARWRGEASETMESSEKSESEAMDPESAPEDPAPVEAPAVEEPAVAEEAAGESNVPEEEPTAPEEAPEEAKDPERKRGKGKKH